MRSSSSSHNSPPTRARPSPAAPQAASKMAKDTLTKRRTGSVSAAVATATEAAKARTEKVFNNPGGKTEAELDDIFEKQCEKWWGLPSGLHSSTFSPT